MTVVRYFAAARAAAGIDQELVEVATTGELRRALVARHGEELARVLAACSLLVDGSVSRDHEQSLIDVAEVDVLPPFAGG